MTRDREKRKRENELRFAKSSFAARPVRLDPSHFYHPGLATTDESRIGCNGTNEQGGRRRGWPRKGKKDRARRVGSLLRPFTSPCTLRPSFAAPTSSFELAAFCGGSTTSRLGATHAEASSSSHATPGCRKRYLTSWPAVSLVPCRHHSLRARTNPVSVSCSFSLSFTSHNPSRVPPIAAIARG